MFELTHPKARCRDKKLGVPHAIIPTAGSGLTVMIILSEHFSGVLFYD
jgi:hypothetical protein